MTLEAAFARHVAGLDLPPGPGFVAVSGGPDSLALLHLLIACRTAHPLDLVVAHVDHGIHQESEAVAASVQRTAEAMGLPFELARLDLGPGTSETVAREARYRALTALGDRRGGGGILLTGHTRDDQIETVLMRVLRGSGPAGLAGMAAVGPVIVRPLLPFGRAEIGDFLRARGITAWADPANVASEHLRSWLRSTVLPLLRHRLPDLDRQVLAVAQQARADREAWDRLLDAVPLAVRRERDGVSVDSAVLRGYDSWLGLALVRALARRAGLTLGPARSARVLRLLGRGLVGRRIELGGGWIAALDAGRLALVRPAVVPLWQGVIAGTTGTLPAGEWMLHWRMDVAPTRLPRDGFTSWFLPGTYAARPWAPGDTIHPLGGPGRRLVVRCMQDGKVPRRERASWPVVTYEGVVAWVPGVCRAVVRSPAPGTEALRIDAEHV